MDTLQISKHELKLVLIATVVVPVLCFILGFYSADKNGISISNQDKLVSLLISNTDSSKIAGSEVSQIEQTDKASLESAPKELKKSTNYLIQAGLYSDYKNAIQHQSTLLSSGIPAVVNNTLKNGTQHYQVILESFESKQDASDFIVATKEKHNIDLYIAPIIVDGIS